MRRREFIAGLRSTAAWPFAARAQQGERVRRIGMLRSGEEDPISRLELAVFQQVLAGLGWIEGRNIEIQRRWGGIDTDRTAAEARELVKLKPDALYAVTSRVVVVLHKAARNIPIVFSAVTDPVG